jgi:hypothetical protein
VRTDVSRSTFDRTRHYRSVLQQQGRVVLDADWNEQRELDEHVRRTLLRDLLGEAAWPAAAAGFQVVPADGELVLTAGRCWVAGLLVENEADVPVDAQPDLPTGCSRVRLPEGVEVPAGAPTPPGTYLAHLDVWSRLVTAIEDPTLLEPALGGTDTTVRVRTVWQVRLAQVGAGGQDVPDDVALPGWAARPPSTGTLALWQEGPSVPLENHLYRVEVLDGGGPGSATYVWSRENGSVLATWDGTDGPVLALGGPAARAGRFEGAALVELTDETRALTGRPGVLVRPRAAHVDRVELDPAATPDEADRSRFDGHARVRRWDGTGTVPPDGSPVELDRGVTVRFGKGTYVCGDHWCFAVRQIPAVTAWPVGRDAPVQVPPHGPEHVSTPLALVGWDGSAWTVRRDLRRLFAPLTEDAWPLG